MQLWRKEKKAGLMYPETIYYGKLNPQNIVRYDSALRFLFLSNVLRFRHKKSIMNEY